MSRTAIELIKRFEGYRRKAAELPDGRWMIGHGHTLTARQGAEVSPDDAEALLLYDLIGVGQLLGETVFTPLTQNQFDALSSFAFSLGPDKFRAADVLRRLNEGALIQAACAMELWRKADVGGQAIVVDALVRRRSAEKALFLTPADNAWTPAPSAILPPLLDTDTRDLVPRDTPARVAASTHGDAVVVTREADQDSQRQEDTHGPSRTAAEAVTARLQTIFQEAPAEADQAPAPVEPAVHPENIPDDPQPQADFGPPLAIQAPADPAAEALFTLESPWDEAESDEDALIGAEDVEAFSGPELSGPDLFETPPAPAEPAAEAANDLNDDLAFLARMPEVAQEASLGDVSDTDADFVAPAVQPLPRQPKGGVLTLVASAVLGLAFFGGGVFWATNAQPMTSGMWLDPRVVGWLAVLAGVGFFTVSAFLLLERLGAASERAARYRR